MSYTPAPWRWMYWHSDGQLVYNVKPVMRPYDGQIENRGDAVLIAAAPELLEALIVCTEQLSHCVGTTNKAVLQAQAAITKAIMGSQLTMRDADVLPCGHSAGLVFGENEIVCGECGQPARRIHHP